eukprot:gene1254-28479_t
MLTMRHQHAQQQQQQLAVPPAVVKCGVCNEAPPKYKCPTCLLRYCSVPCFKSHKQKPCSPPLPHTATRPRDSGGGSSSSSSSSILGAGSGAAMPAKGAAIDFAPGDRLSQR